MRQVIERFGVWIGLVLLAGAAIWQRNWLLLGTVGVASIAFALLRPLDRRANERMGDGEPPR